MPRDAEESDDWLGTKAAAARLGITARTLYRLINEDLVPAYKLGRVIRIRASDVDAFLERSRIQPGELKHLLPGAEEPETE